MAEDDFAAGDAEEGDLTGIDDLEAKRFSGKKIVLIALAALLVLGGGATAFFMLGGESEEEAGKSEAKVASKQQILFVELPEFVVNLNTGGDQSRYLRASISLEVSSARDQAVVEENLPRVLDDFQIYLRELRVQDLNGSAGLERLKEELLRRLNRSVAPAQVRDVLFREMLVQ